MSTAVTAAAPLVRQTFVFMLVAQTFDEIAKLSRALGQVRHGRGGLAHARDRLVGNGADAGQVLAYALALFGGMLLGKTKLAPRVSPKKTREGAVSGLLNSLIERGKVSRLKQRHGGCQKAAQNALFGTAQFAAQAVDVGSAQLE